MGKRVSHSLLDPWLGPPIKRMYSWLPIPRWFPPEGLIAVGHLSAIAGAVGFAFSAAHWWGGVLGAVGVAGNHLADCIDGTHARSTGQCRNGGELLDHFTDPLSFAYWMVGLAVSCGRLDLGLAAVICIYAIALITNLKAKIVGEFTLATIGPTEFKTMLVVYGVVVTLATSRFVASPTAGDIAFYFLSGLILIGLIQVPRSLFKAVRDVNRDGPAADTTEWERARER